MPARTNSCCHCFFKKTYWISVVVLDPYMLWQHDLNIFWQCWDKSWQLPDVKTAVQVVCYIMPSLANNGKKINCRSTNTSYNLKEINPAPKTAFLFTQNCWRKQHVGLKTHEEHLAVTSADLGIHGECCCVRHIEGLQTQVFWSLFLACDPFWRGTGSFTLQRVWISQFPFRRGQSLPSCALEQLTTAIGPLLFQMHSSLRLLFLTLPMVKYFVKASKLKMKGAECLRKIEFPFTPANRHMWG